MRYLSYYGLYDNPFEENKNYKAYLSHEYKELNYRLKYLKETRGIGLITGGYGVGKTYTIKCFLESLNEELYKVIYITSTNMTQFEMLLRIAEELGLSAGNCFKSSLEQNVRKEIVKLNKELIIIIDNIHNLADQALKELEYLTTFDYGRNKSFMIVMVGNKSFKDIVIRKSIFENLRQKIVVNYELKTLEEKEIKEYILHLLKEVGCSKEIFENNCYTALANISKGNIRILNKLVSACLMLGYQKEERKISCETVMQAREEIII